METRKVPLVSAVGLFALALAIRLLYLNATVDAAWPYGFGFKGDALVFMAQALGMHQGDLPVEQQFELGLPLRAPGGAWLVYWLWTENLEVMRHGFAVLGAGVAPALYLVSRRRFGERVALFAGAFTAVATGPLLLSATPSSETPYLLLATISVGMLGDLRERLTHRFAWVAGWSAVQGLLCLFRAEHLLFLVAGLGWIVWRRERPAATALVGLAAFALTLLPWQLSAHRAITALNERPVTVHYALAWDPGAQAAVAAMPAFARQSSVGFIESTVLVRGKDRVGPEDIGILREAYDYLPERLPTWPFVALSGPMNFYIANHEQAAGGFSRAPMFAPPPLRGGPGRFPPGLVLPEELTPSYPPHLRILNHGFRLGLGLIAADPLAWLGRVGGKLLRTWEGVAHGFGGYALPVGISGIRRQVDLVVPTGTWAGLWRVLVLLAFLLGAREAWRRPDARPWMLWIGVRLAIVVAFFGYARQGALLVPAAALFLGLLADRCWDRWGARCCGRHGLRIGLAVLAGLLAAEIYRFQRPPEVRVSGVKIEQVDASRALIRDQPVLAPWR